MSEPANAKGGSTALLRGLTLIPAAAIIVTNVIGSGVFVKARVMTCNVGTPGMVLLAYGLAGLFTLAGALTLAELSAMMPHAGGQYNFVGAAFGRLYAFLFAWIEVLFDGAATSAAIAMVFVIFLNDLLGGALTPVQAQMVTVGILTAIMLLVLASVRSNGAFVTVVTALKVLLVLGIGVLAFVLGDGSMGHFAQSGAAGACTGVPEAARLGATGFGAAVVGALWGFAGWNVVCFVAEEVHDPGRTLPRALIWGTALVVALYLLINAGYYYVLSPEAVASVPEEASVAGEVLVRLFGAGAAALMSAGMMLSSFGSMHANMLTISRVPFALARDGLLPRGLARVSPRTHVPARAVLLLGACAVGFALSGTFDLLTDVVVFVMLLFNGLSIAAIYVLRRAFPDAPRPYRVWGYPVVPALYLLATLYLMVNTLIATPGRALAGLAIVALGVPVYALYGRRLPEPAREDWLAGNHAAAQAEEPSA